MRRAQELTTAFLRSTVMKVGSGFVLGAALVGGVASAVVSPAPAVKACVDNKTQAMYLSPTGACAKTRTLVDLGSGGINVKAVAAAVTPSVVTVSVVASSGSGTGSGSIIQSNSTSSYILTNNHVVEGAAIGGKITVEFSNGDTAEATIVGRDSTYDLAVIKVSLGNLPVIAIGDSSALSIGDPVIAIGSPLGLSSTVTSGIVSALNRPVTTGSTSVTSFIDAIQTDAAINPGNSGGALVDAQGRIVGVNSAIASLSTSSTSQSGSIGLGFSIPINEANRVATELITTGKSTRPVLGVFFDNTYTGVGAKISSLSLGEGAAVAGVPAGSIIRSIDGFRIADQVAAIVKIRSYAPLSVVSLVVDLPNGGGSKTFKVTLGSAPSQ